MAFDDALFKESSPAPARARVPAPAAAPAPAPAAAVETAPEVKAEPYRPDNREPAVVWENFNKAFETQEYPSVNWAIGSDWGMGTSYSTPEGYRRAATERMERLYGPDPTATTAPAVAEPVTEQTLRDAGFTSGEIASWRSGQGSKDYAEKAGRGFIYYSGDFTPATAENVAKITALIEADIAKNAATRERLIATDTGKRTVLVGDARPQLLAENLRDLETSDSKLNAKIEGLNRQLERAKRYAAMGTPATGITPAIGKSKTRNQISEILKFGSAADMKDAIAEIEKPDDKVMDERANLQKQNRGCD
jgi:hypothetical protein